MHVDHQGLFDGKAAGGPRSGRHLRRRANPARHPCVGLTDRVSAGPHEDGSKVERDPISDRELVRPHGKAAPLLEAGDAPLDCLALLVCLSVEAARSRLRRDLAEDVTDLVGGLRDDGPDAASTEVPANRAGIVCAIRQDGCWTGSWPPQSAARNPDSGHDRLEGRRVAGLAAVTWMAGGRAWLSPARWTFVLRPPRERPRA